ncbi:SusC/RagA family TonB-linked outer membrane protein [Sphingobacterium sp. SG20118]|uniref:SusC/RagA family TonB-linked outer membrane protein n=1 Tax=Sphingobacterium sp. SG20118 TaxID=3367156 RepID=UPI0037DFC6AA
MNNFYRGGRVHAYFKGILQSINNLKNRCSKLGITRRYPTVEYALENNIAHATSVCFISQYSIDESSSIIGDSCVPELGLGRHSFGSSSAVVRQFPEAQSKRSRTTPEQVSKRSRTSVEGHSNKPRTGAEEKVEKHPSTAVLQDFKSGASDRPMFCFSGSKQASNSGQLRTVFVPASENIRPAKYLLITFQLPFLGQPMFGRCAGGVQEMGEVRSGLEASTNPVPRMYCLGTVSSRERYRKGTGSVLRSYWRGTKEVLRSYWKGTGISTIGVSSARESDSSSFKGALSQISSFKASKFLSQVFTHTERDNSLRRLKLNSNLTQRVDQAIGNKCIARLFGSTRFSIASILLLLLTFGMASSQAQSKQGYVLQGTVVSAVDNKPLQGVSVRVEAENIKISTKKDGSFSIPVANRKGKVKFTNVGYKTVEQEYTSSVILSVQLYASDNQLDEVEVVSTGYQKIPKERATGSFEVIGNKELNIGKSTHFINRLEGLSPSIRFEKRVPNVKPEEQIFQRGNSTFLGSWSPLIILDNFPYEGDLTNINPNDIESVTILKDAAAASIWGTRSGSGVIVLTSKSGSKLERIRLEMSSNIQIGQKPDIYKLPFMSSKSFIESEEFLFENKYYDWMINYPDYTISPIVNLLDQLRSGKIDRPTYDSEKTEYEKNDVRDDYMKHVYQNSVTQQYYTSMAYGGKKMDSRISLGFDRTLENLRNNNIDRISAKYVSTIRPSDRLSIDFNAGFSDNGKKTQGDASKVGYGSLYSGAGKTFYPYVRLVDDNGVGINLETVTFRKSYIDTLAGARLFPEHYNVKNELSASENRIHVTDATLSIGAQYKLSNAWRINASYQFQRSLSKMTDNESIDSYYAQHYINLYTQFTPNALTYNVPVGDIYTRRISDLYSHYVRTTTTFEKELGPGLLNVLGGVEMKSMDNRIEGYKLYGYNADRIEFSPVDYKSSFPLLNGLQGRDHIFNGNKLEEYKQRFFSVFMNGSYIVNDRYILSGSVRRDAANLFGVSANNKWQPLWSVGAAWDISKESFSPTNIFSYLKVRGTYGVNGNITTQISAYPTIAYDGIFPYTGYTNAYMMNPPNPDYRAERVEIFNAGLDFATINRKLNGSLDFYVKGANDLVALANIDPTTGFYTQAVNIANFKNKGVELNLESENMSFGEFRWNSNLIFTYGRSIVTKYNYEHESVSNYMWTTTAPNPVVGRDLYGLYSFQFAGLDHQTGAPLGYYKGEVSDNYGEIMSVGIDDVKYMGPSLPLYSGFLANTFSWKSLSLRASMQYKFKYFYRRRSINYTGLAQYWQMQDDFDDRWEQQGDEMHTNVPAFIYPMNYQRDQFYQNTDVLIEPADHIRLKDINLEYVLDMKSNGFKSMHFYLNADNLNLVLWRKSNYSNDPDFNFLVPTPRTFTFGVKATF